MRFRHRIHFEARRDGSDLYDTLIENQQDQKSVLCGQFLGSKRTVEVSNVPSLVPPVQYIFTQVSADRN